MLLKTGKTLPLLLVFCRCNFHLVTLGPECSQQGFCWWTPPGLQNPELTALLEAKFHIFNFWKFKRGTILVKRKRFWQPEWFRKCLFHCWVLSDVVQVVFKFYFSIISFLKIKKKKTFMRHLFCTDAGQETGSCNGSWLCLAYQDFISQQNRIKRNIYGLVDATVTKKAWCWMLTECPVSLVSYRQGSCGLEVG